MPSFSLFIGYDPREDAAYQVCAASIKKRARRPLSIMPLKLDKLRAKGLYRRPTEKHGNKLWDVISGAPMSTEFAISRFLVPHLASTEWAAFCDCDFLWLEDIENLFALADPRHALMCVKHDHSPPETEKMDQQAQLRYARKNWSSLMLWNCRHPAHQALTLDAINARPGRDLHAFYWLKDEEIGALPEKWNWLEGHSSMDLAPAAVHYTRGGPWFGHMKNGAHADLWLKEAAELRGTS